LRFSVVEERTRVHEPRGAQIFDRSVCQTVIGAIAIRQRTSQRAVFPHSDAEG